MGSVRDVGVDRSIEVLAEALKFALDGWDESLRHGDGSLQTLHEVEIANLRALHARFNRMDQPTEPTSDVDSWFTG